MNNPEKEFSEEELQEIMRNLGGVEIEVPEEKEPKLEELSRGSWNMELRGNANNCLANMNVSLEEYRKWEKHLFECNKLFIKAHQLDESGYRVRCFRDEEGNLSYRAEEKEEVGFTRMAKGGE